MKTILLATIEYRLWSESGLEADIHVQTLAIHYPGETDDIAPGDKIYARQQTAKRALRRLIGIGFEIASIPQWQIITLVDYPEKLLI